MTYDPSNKNWSEEVTSAEKKKREAEQKINALGNWNYGRQVQYDNALNKFLNREDFKFDMNNNALYKQYKDQYAALGKLAMQDTMGQAAAMTGGYANSYAQSVGQQAYQQYLNKANEMLPSLYSMALDRYNAEGDYLANRVSALSNDRSFRYGEWSDRYGRLATDRDYYGNNYNNVYNAALQAYQSKLSGSGGGSGSGGRRSSGRKKKSGKSSNSGNTTTASTTVSNAPYGIPANEVINSGVGPVSSQGLADAIARGIVGVSPNGKTKKTAGLPAYDSIEALKYIW